MAKLQTPQGNFTILVANLAGSSDPSKGTAGNPVKIRTGFTQSIVPEVSRTGYPVGKVVSPKSPGQTTYMGKLQYTVPSVPVAASATVVVADNDFSYQASLTVGPFTVSSGDDYVVGGTVNLTATALAAALDSLPGLNAVAVLDTVTITGPFGPEGNDWPFYAVYRGTVQNLTLSNSTGFLTGAEPTVGPPEIL